MPKTAGITKRSIVERDVAGLVPYARNARTHGKEQIDQIAASIREFGWTNPILIDEDSGIIAGHGRLLAARKLGQATVPCLVLEGLSEQQKRALVIADNRLALNAGWDDELLASELKGLADDFDLGLLGFGTDELDELFGSFETGSIDDQTRLDEKKPIQCPACGETFSV